MTPRATVLILALTGGAGACADHRVTARGAGGVRIERPLARVLPSHVGAVYMRVVNDSNVADRLVSVESKDAQDGQLHEVLRVDGETMMRESPSGFTVPANGELVLERGGKHVMFFGLTAHDDLLPMLLHFEHAGAVAIEAPVQSALAEER